MLLTNRFEDMENVEIDANVVTTLGMAQSCAVWLMTIFPQRTDRDLLEKLMEQFGYGHCAA